MEKRDRERIEIVYIYIYTYTYVHIETWTWIGILARRRHRLIITTLSPPLNALINVIGPISDRRWLPACSLSSSSTGWLLRRKLRSKRRRKSQFISFQAGRRGWTPGIAIPISQVWTWLKRAPAENRSTLARVSASTFWRSSQSTITAAFCQTIGLSGAKPSSSRKRRLERVDYTRQTRGITGWFFNLLRTIREIGIFIGERRVRDKPTLARSRDPSNSRRASRLASFSLIRITRFTSYSIARAVDN